MARYDGDAHRIVPQIVSIMPAMCDTSSPACYVSTFLVSRV